MSRCLGRGGEAVIRIVPTQLRATVQRSALPFLVLLSAGIIVLGKADQMVIDSVRMTVTDTLAPALDLVSRPVAGVGTMIDRVHGVVSLYQENRRLEEENERLLQWQQTALKLAGDNKHVPRWDCYARVGLSRRAASVRTRRDLSYPDGRRLTRRVSGHARSGRHRFDRA